MQNPAEERDGIGEAVRCRHVWGRPHDGSVCSRPLTVLLGDRPGGGFPTPLARAASGQIDLNQLCAVSPTIPERGVVRRRDHPPREPTEPAPEPINPLRDRVDSTGRYNDPEQLTLCWDKVCCRRSSLE